MADETVGEFAAALRAQIADVRAELVQARASNDLEWTTSLGLRLRYLLEVAADGGIDPDETQAAGSGESQLEDADG